jgi:hypothetical protein
LSFIPYPIDRERRGVVPSSHPSGEVSCIVRAGAKFSDTGAPFARSMVHSGVKPA